MVCLVELSELLPDGTDLDGVLGELSELLPDGTDLDGKLGELPDLLPDCTDLDGMLGELPKLLPIDYLFMIFTYYYIYSFYRRCGCQPAWGSPATVPPAWAHYTHWAYYTHWAQNAHTGLFTNTRI